MTKSLNRIAAKITSSTVFTLSASEASHSLLCSMINRMIYIYYGGVRT